MFLASFKDVSLHTHVLKNIARFKTVSLLTVSLQMQTVSELSMDLLIKTRFIICLCNVILASVIDRNRRYTAV